VALAEGAGKLSTGGSTKEPIRRLEPEADLHLVAAQVQDFCCLNVERPDDARDR
jgi:hypothetical protein